MINPDLDGVDHINIYLKGKTPLGRMLSNLADYSVLIPYAGFFRTLEGYWYYLGTPDEKLRTLDGWDAKKLGQWLREDASRTIQDDFVAKIRGAMWYKLVQHDVIKLELAKSYLPFAHYYVYAGKVVEPTQFGWITQIWEEYRRAIR